MEKTLEKLITNNLDPIDMNYLLDEPELEEEIANEQDEEQE